MNVTDQRQSRPARRSTRGLSGPIAGLLLACVLTPLSAGATASAWCVQEPAPAEDTKKLDAWPELPDAAAAKREVTRLRKARTEEMATDALLQLREMGAGAAPLLLEAVAKEKNDEALARLEESFADVTDERHSQLVAQSWSHKRPAVRMVSLRRSAGLLDAGLEPAAAALMVDLEAKAKAGKKGAPSDDELAAAAAAACASGALEGLSRTLQLAQDNWKFHGEVLRGAWPGLKGSAAAEKLLADALRAAQRDPERVALLRAFGFIATPESSNHVTHFLDVESNTVRVAAINALRGMIDGDPPLKNLSVFAAIDEAKKWKARL